MPCYIFDVDDTLVEYVDFDMREWYEFIVRPVAERYKIPFSLEIWKDIVKGKKSRRYTERYGLDAKTFWREVDARNLEYRKAMLRKGRLRAYPDTDILKYLNGKKCAWSVSSEECIRFVLSSLDLINYFDFIIGKDYKNYAYLDYLKPSPKFIEIIKEKLHCDRCVVIGDGNKEMLAAKRAGCLAIYINRSGKKSEYADFTITSLRELLNKNFL